MIADFSFEDHFSIGDKIYGFCNGYFGRDDYEDKVVELVTKDYIVFRYDDTTSLTEENGNHIEVTEHRMLNISDVVYYNQKTKMSRIKSRLLESFKEWKVKEWN